MALPRSAEGTNSFRDGANEPTAFSYLRPQRLTPVNTRRQFLIQAPLGLMSVAAACRVDSQKADAQLPTAGAPPTFGTMPAVGPEVTPAIFAEAEKLVQVQLSPAERDMAARTWRTTMAALLERRMGPRKIMLEPT